MKKIFAIIFLAGIFGINANGQIRRPTDSTQNVISNSSKRTDRLEAMNSLNLTKQQMTQLKEFRQNLKKQRDAINNDQSLSGEQKQSKLKDLHKEQKEQLNNILTPEQMEKLEKQRRNSKMQNDNRNSKNGNGSLLDN